ncbi:MAG: cytochrome C biogenesis protein, partial [Cytophagales bacterium]
MMISCIIIIMLKINKILHIILIVSSIYSMISNGKTLLQIYIDKKKISGGIISHIGISIIIIGILFSSGYEKTISINTTGLLYNKKFPNEINQKNILLWINEPIKIKNYKIMYSGQKIKSNEFPEYISKKSINITTNPYKAVIKKKIKKNKKIKFNKKNIININPKEKYYEIIYKKKKEKKFKLYPKLQINNSNGFVSSPDIKMKINKDIYTYVSSIPDPEKIQN